MDLRHFFERIHSSMIGAAQWIIQLGRFDIAVHVMTISSFRAQPRVGHLERMKRVYGFAGVVYANSFPYALHSFVSLRMF